MGFSRQKYWNGLHPLLQWTMFCQDSSLWPVHLGWPYLAQLIGSLSWTRLWSMWPSLWVFCDFGFHSVCPLMDKDKRLMVASWWERLTEGETGSVLMGGAMFSKSLIQFSVDGLGSCYLPGPNYGGCNEDNGDLLQKLSCMQTATLSVPSPLAGHRLPMPPLDTPRHLRASLGQSLVGSLLLSPGSWCA